MRFVVSRIRLKPTAKNIVGGSISLNSLTTKASADDWGIGNSSWVIAHTARSSQARWSRKHYVTPGPPRTSLTVVGCESSDYHRTAWVDCGRKANARCGSTAAIRRCERECPL